MILAPFLIWLVCVGIGAVLIGYLIRNYDSSPLLAEGFAGVRSCPAGAVEYIDNLGKTMCCKGQLVNGKCKQVICTLSESYGSVISCSEYSKLEFESKSGTYCPSSMPNYFDTGREKGCTDRPVSAAGIPESGGKRCKVYGNATDAVRNMDSCDLLNQMEMADCPIKAASKSLVSTGETDSSQKPLPPLIACTYSTGKSVMPVTCYTKESAELWAMAKFGGEWAAKLKEKGLSLDKMINICPASGNYYVSQSLAKSAVTF